ncbi:MAG: polysaccharide deacetylase family protein [Anaerolineae bacterium]|nr:polysaccharide deacetylase family protein [Anaerolineae bacterium]
MSIQQRISLIIFSLLLAVGFYVSFGIAYEGKANAVSATRTIQKDRAAIIAPILLYHHIAEGEDSRYYVSPARFEQQMSLLYSLGYTTIPVSRLVEAMHDDTVILPARPLVVTFDDGNLDVYQTAYPIMQKYAFTATMYLVGKYLNSEGFVSTDQMREMIAAGWEIGSHSMSHVKLFEAQSLSDEILESRLFLEEKIDTPVYSFAYPFGIYDAMLAEKVKSYGYRAGLGLGTSSEHTLESLFYLSRIEIKQDTHLYEFNASLPWKSTDYLYLRMSN